MGTATTDRRNAEGKGVLRDNQMSFSSTEVRRPGRPADTASRPAERPERLRVVPDLRHAPYLTAVELHHIDIVGGDGLAGRRHRSAIGFVRPVEDREGGDGMPLRVRGEGLQFIAPVGKGGEQALRPFGVAFQGLHIGQGVGLARERRAVMAPGLAAGSALAGLAGVEKAPRTFSYGHGLVPRLCFRWEQVEPAFPRCSLVLSVRLAIRCLYVNGHSGNPAREMDWMSTS